MVLMNVSDRKNPPSQAAPPRHRPILAKKDLANSSPVSSKSLFIIPGFCSGKFIQPSPYPLAVSYIMSKGKPGQRAGPDRTMRTEPPPEEQFCSFQSARTESPDHYETPAKPSVFRKNLPISKGHIPYRSMMLSQRAPRRSPKNPGGFFVVSRFDGLSQPGKAKGGISRSSIFSRTWRKTQGGNHTA